MFREPLMLISGLLQDLQVRVLIQSSGNHRPVLGTHDTLEASLRELFRKGDVQACKAARKSADGLLKSCGGAGGQGERVAREADSEAHYSCGGL
ncbi:hypothetical protein F3Y22_tig00002840pilonHSYRG01343 [Hibiscus syriacus]|uniref:Uncharacterized protein n=1 Tax=Hibiscus syriacus TaxID=106335 RepID=A0A6A3CPU7_HIBSY|nr:hypothetical protein F3Y22_tig00002840pilonHSYRG01343 [Hibiscus syriacus]